MFRRRFATPRHKLCTVGITLTKEKILFLLLLLFLGYVWFVFIHRDGRWRSPVESDDLSFPICDLAVLNPDSLRVEKESADDVTEYCKEWVWGDKITRGGYGCAFCLNTNCLRRSHTDCAFFAITKRQVVRKYILILILSVSNFSEWLSWNQVLAFSYLYE